MTLVALLFIAIGVADITRERFRRPIGPIVGGTAGILVLCLSAWGLGAPVGPVLALAGATLAWIAATAIPTGGQSGYLKLALLGALITATWAFPIASDDGAPLARWYAALPYSFTTEINVDAFMLGLGSVLFLIETANIIVRLILAAAPRATAKTVTTADATTPARRSWFGRGATVAVSPAPQGVLPLKGGRILGPFERLFLFALVMAGQFTALAAVVAAKGIIRFPEISKDTADGSKAEYFLVGSFASWAVVLVVALIALSP
ncbi:hypothetical protein OH146_03345 [Salinibacterium sp. SYSU T00001]|uniref:hypothetical protein n=1 Tax=Homoserinimonas sedimenticola TaxID=2986805 RepID=UPI002235B468|nr:hypothetical protein [Salinibacterium sedimenticola]MCW4384805.1 hypothetical protein [Salinibacterium sedimenticola]